MKNIILNGVQALQTAVAEKATEAAAAAPMVMEDLTTYSDYEPGNYWLPPAVNVTAADVDWLFFVILGLSVFCFVAITAVVVLFTWKYRHRKGHKSVPSSSHNDAMEVTWTVIPSIICVFLFVWGWQGFLDLNTPPKHAMEIGVVGQKWNWSFNYPGSATEDAVTSAELHVPVGKPVRLMMRSDDVLHSFYIPAFRIKNDVIPMRYTKLWFEATEPGTYRVYCAEYCGQAHSDMKTKVVVHETGGYEKWLKEQRKSCADKAKELAWSDEQLNECRMNTATNIYKVRGCANCHSIDGAAGTGPTFKGMWDQAREFADGSAGKVDANYIRESIVNPMAKVRAGFNPVMPTYQGKLTDEQIDSIINWMKTL